MGPVDVTSDLEPCAPAFVTDAIFPFALALLGVVAVATLALFWVTWRFKISPLWLALAVLLTAGSTVLVLLASQTC